MIARKTTLIILIQILNGILGFIGLKFIALYMQPWEYGIVGFAYGFVSLFTIVSTFGFIQAHTKKVSEGKNLGRCIGTFISIRVVQAIFLGTSVFIFMFFWKIILNRGFESDIHENAVYILLGYFILQTITQTFVGTFTAKKEIFKAQFPLLIYTITRIIASIFVAYSGYGVIELAYTYLFGEIFHLALVVWFFRGYPISRPSWTYAKEYLHFALPLAIATSSSIIMTNIDKVLIQLFWSAQQVGEYFAVFNLTRYIILFATAVGLLLFPTISEHHAKKEFESIKKLVLSSERYLSMIVFPIILCVILFAEPIINILLSAKYEQALLIFYVLPFFPLLEVLSRPYVSKVIGMNYPKIVRNRIFLMVCINLILNVILIPQDIQSFNIQLFGLGAFGAALATVISYFVGFMYIRFISWKISGLFWNPKIFIHLFSSIIVFVLGYILLYHYNLIDLISRWFQLVCVVSISFLIYFGLLAIFHEFTRKDFNFFLDNLNIKKMVLYIRGELGKK